MLRVSWCEGMCRKEEGSSVFFACLNKLHEEGWDGIERGNAHYSVLLLGRLLLMNAMSYGDLRLKRE